MDERIICAGCAVGEARIAAAADAGARDFAAVSAATGAGGGCGTCRRAVARILWRRWW